MFFVDPLLTPVTMIDQKVAICVTYYKCRQRSLWHQHDLTSCEFYS